MANIEWIDAASDFESLRDMEMRIRRAMFAEQDNVPGELRDLAHQAARVCAAALEYTKHIQNKYEIKRLMMLAQQKVEGDGL